MDTPALDDTHTRAICEEIGERLRALLNSSTSGETSDFDDRLREFFDIDAEDGRPAGSHLPQ